MVAESTQGIFVICKVSHFAEIFFYANPFLGQVHLEYSDQVLTLHLECLPFGSKMNLGMLEDSWSRAQVKFHEYTQVSLGHEMAREKVWTHLL